MRRTISSGSGHSEGIEPKRRIGAEGAIRKLDRRRAEPANIGSGGTQMRFTTFGKAVAYIGEAAIRIITQKGRCDC
jgi:hypothetical protein